MGRWRLLWKLYPSYILIMIAAVVLVGFYTNRSIHNFYQEHLDEDLEARARFLTVNLTGKMSKDNASKIDRQIKELGESTGTRITVILPDGTVIADSDENPSRMDLHHTRPEVVEAANGGRGMAMRYSNTIQADMMYVAVPIYDGGHLAGFIRTSLPMTSIIRQLNRLNHEIWLGGIIVAILAAVVGYFVSRSITRPLVKLTRGAELFSKGDLSFRMDVPSTLEIGNLATAMNQMASQLNGRIRTIMEQRNRQEAILSSMAEGVIAIDMDGCILLMNDRAGHFFSIEPDKVQGQELHAIIRNPDLHRFVSRALDCPDVVEGELILHHEEERFAQAHGTVLRDMEENIMGALIVLNEVTDLKRLENIRRDFVANVSHELRTPITSIKGFIETLLDGALNNPEEAERFLRIVARQADRLNAIIEDLLSLSRVETDIEQNEVELTRSRIAPVLYAALQNCQQAASEKNMEVKIECDKELSARLNPRLLEQAVNNLLSNAIKYSPAGSTITLTGQGDNQQASIKVSDEGPGIDKRHLARIFERFYRVDKARSREMGGTGLGLAIVKHIVLAHEGDVSVESEPDQGTTFTISLPPC